MNKLKVMTFIGTRPEIIRLSRTMVRLDEFMNQVIVHTGQNYDYELNEVFFKDLDLRKPDHFLNVDTSSLEASVGDIIHGQTAPYPCVPDGSREQVFRF